MHSFPFAPSLLLLRFIYAQESLCFTSCEQSLAPVFHRERGLVDIPTTWLAIRM